MLHVDVLHCARVGNLEVTVRRDDGVSHEAVVRSRILVSLRNDCCGMFLGVVFACRMVERNLPMWDETILIRTHKNDRSVHRDRLVL